MLATLTHLCQLALLNADRITHLTWQAVGMGFVALLVSRLFTGREA